MEQTQETPKFSASENSTQFSKAMASKQEALKFFKDYPNQMRLDNLLDAGLEICVQNNLDGKYPGRLAVDFTINGRKQVIPVPNSPVPICLNDYMVARDIGTSGSLRDMLFKEVLVLVHPDDAQKIWASEYGQRQIAKYKSTMSKMASAVANVSASRKPVGAENVKVVEGVVSDRMKSFVLEYESVVKAEVVDQSKKQDVLDTIFSNQKSFSLADVEYLQKAVEGDQKAGDMAAELLIIVGTR